MAASSYDAALARVLAHEGGYSNHPSDPGGPTNFGITIADYRRYVKPNATATDIRAMRLDEAKVIYKAHYWDAMCCDDVPAGLDYALFDYGVNSGVSRAVKVLQRLVGSADDGRVTDALLALVRKRDTADLVAKLCDERLAFLKGLKTWPVFGAGWSRRVAEVRSAALIMAATAPAERDAVPDGAPPVKRPVRTALAGTIAAAGAALAARIQDVPGPAIAISVIGTAALVLGGWFLWRRYRQRRQAASTE